MDLTDLVTKSLLYIPKYIMDYGSLLSGPKRFMAKKNTSEDNEFGSSLAFLGLSMFLVVLMEFQIHTPFGHFLDLHGAYWNPLFICRFSKCDHSSDRMVSCWRKSQSP